MRILIVLHVRSEDDGSTFIYISYGSKQGNHWSPLAIDIENKSAYYRDSLVWPVPHNLISELEHNLLMLEGKLGIDILVVYKILSPFINLVVVTTCRYLDQCPHLYPLQTCSNICGIIVMCMVAIMTETWEGWQEWNNLTAPEFLLNPSLHGKYISGSTPCLGQFKIKLILPP